jgi:Na+/H+-translocating membrane pyrophosphatase
MCVCMCVCVCVCLKERVREYSYESVFLYHTVPHSLTHRYGLGGSSVALFGRVGGGIFTKAADVGADMFKIEKGLVCTCVSSICM